MFGLRLMPVWMKLCLLAAILGVLLRGQPTPATPVVFGTPPGGVGAACTAPQIGYLNTSTGCLATCVSSVWSCGAGAGTTSPGGSNTQVQFNDSNAFGGNSGFTFDKTTGAVTVGATVLLNPIAITPVRPVSVTPQGAPGSAQWCYAAIEYNLIGPSSISTTRCTSIGAATLDATNFNRIVLGACAVPGCTIDLLITTAPGGGSTGRIAAGLSGGATYDDQSGAGDGFYSTDPGFTIGAAFPNLHVPGRVAFGNAAVLGGGPYSDVSNFGVLYDFESTVTLTANDGESAGFVSNNHYTSSGFNNNILNWFQTVVDGGNVVTIESISSFATYAGAGTATAVVGGRFLGNCLSGTCTDVAGGRFSANSEGGATATAKGILVESAFKDTGLITTNIGIDVEDQTAGAANFALRTGLGLVQFGDALKLSGDVVNPFRQVKNTQSATAPGAGIADLRWIAGTNAGTCKLVGAAGTSATEVTIIDNVGGGC